MPRTPINYSNTSIYKICCKDLNITEIYIGHSTDMTKRKCTHKCSCNNENGRDYNLKVYQYIRDNGGWNNWDMIEIERFSAIDGDDAKKRERYWIESLKATLNSEIPTRNQKEYYINNVEKIKEWNKENYINNIEKFKKKLKQYYINNAEKIIEKTKHYNINNVEKIKEYQKQYNINNAEKLRELNKQYRINNAQKIKENEKKIIICECGSEVRKRGLTRHQQTKKHQDLLNTLN